MWLRPPSFEAYRALSAAAMRETRSSPLRGNSATPPLKMTEAKPPPGKGWFLFPNSTRSLSRVATAVWASV